MRKVISDVGPVASADIPADTVLFTVPRASIICKETSSLVTKLPEVFDPPQDEDHNMEGTGDDGDEMGDGSQDSWTTLILILIYEHLLGPASKWRPYLDVLPAGPADFSTPMFWTADELSELQASPVASKVGREEAESMIRTKIVPVIRAREDVFFPSGSSPCSDDELVHMAFRMGSVIMAYAFDLEKDEADAKTGEAEGDDDEWIEDREGLTTLGMVPMADILNADASFNAHIEHGEDALAATSLRPIAKGEEILNYYGPLSNGELLRRYGYVTTTHRRWNLVDLAWDSVLTALKEEVSLKEKEWEKVAGLLDEDELQEGFVIERGAADPDSEGRVEEATKEAGVPEDLLEQLKEVMKAVKKVKPEAVPDKIVRDRAIYGAIAKTLDKRTRQYGTTLEQDLELCEKSNGVVLDRKRMALDVRIGEKALLRQAREAVRARLAELASAARDGDGRSAKRRKL